MKRLLIILVLVVLALAVIQCGSDDDDDDDYNLSNVLTCESFCDSLIRCDSYSPAERCVSDCENAGVLKSDYIKHCFSIYRDNCDDYINCLNDH